MEGSCKMKIDFVYKNRKGEVSNKTIDLVSSDHVYFQGICNSSNRLKTYLKESVISNLDLIPEAYGEVKHVNNRRRSNLEFDVCFTGFSKLKKDELIEKAESNKIVVRKSVVVNLSLLCVGEKAGPKKMDDATKQGSIVLDEFEFLNMIETGELPE